jgi:hypothetical protein
MPSGDAEWTSEDSGDEGEPVLRSGAGVPNGMRLRGSVEGGGGGGGGGGVGGARAAGAAAAPTSAAATSATEWCSQLTTYGEGGGGHHRRGGDGQLLSRRSAALLATRFPAIVTQMHLDEVRLRDCVIMLKFQATQAGAGSDWNRVEWIRTSLQEVFTNAEAAFFEVAQFKMWAEQRTGEEQAAEWCETVAKNQAAGMLSVMTELHLLGADDEHGARVCRFIWGGGGGVHECTCCICLA